MLKKQTVWLLTMLSLMVVLSIYYLNAPSEGDLAYFDTEDVEGDQTTSQSLTEITNKEETTNEEGKTDEDATEEADSSTVNSDEFFAAVRMEITNQRSMEKERLEKIVSSNDASTEEKNEAYEAMKEIEYVESKEMILEDTLKSTVGYDQVLVRNMEGDNIVVTVQADSLTPKEANTIIQHTKDEFGEVDVEVVYQTS
ncbi:SpoIIIAH-like family protein [Gracilibacillus dipsosauri]|uniref:Stage III sporulation protein AH n=1 Tax=Gracilibacillus dipsosauri TaxID=178340 RepID=A0A317KYD8_9BACI|nr:SpoIIIAH-like family protein [Gracilibacillus dipsosauri]PWU68552.1 stage III sporulation protein AH [Gracilibacillus dipsosauri]